MAYTTEDYLAAWAAQTTVELRRETLMMSLTTQTGTERWVAGARNVSIPKPDWAYNSTDSEGVRASARARGGDWASALEGDQSIINFTRSGGFSSANKIDAEDVMELPWPVLEQTRSRQAYEMRKEIESAVYAIITAAIAAETSTPNFEALGSNTNNISRTTGKAATSAAAALIYDAIDDFSLKLADQDVDGAGDAVGQKYIIMRPNLFRILREYMVDKGLSWDQLTRDLLVNNSVLVGRGYQGRLLGIDIFSWTGIPAPSSTAASNSAANRASNHQMLAGVRMAVAANVRSVIAQYFTPSTNQVEDNPSYLFRQAGDYGAVVLEPNLLTLYGVDGGADS